MVEHDPIKGEGRWYRLRLHYTHVQPLIRSHGMLYTDLADLRKYVARYHPNLPEIQWEEGQ